ncbi:hypothetical protein BDV95DRAFT_597831 [Massariosphaeria phaeospora]|uniref:F-box domain-containing protein n=1 Tax=Massariosphaeria phaeospora TaxID=100035 RepID=A0A7C8M3E6_9PLEO|nr:hypothetical protein BDV95DRAFT_597831 [Massariosphaeria phaeospora]
MTISLDRLPFDILFYIASTLQFDDVLSLGHTCRQLKALLEESTLCRRAIEADFLHSKEALLAQNQTITYNEALRGIFSRRNAFSSAQPFAARVIGPASAFTYRQGILCLLRGNTIHVSDMHSSSGSVEIDLSSIINSVPESSSSSRSEPKLSLLYYSDEIIAVHVERKGRSNNGRIFAISTKRYPSGGNRVLKEVEVESSYKLFARHTESFLYYGTYTGTGSHGHHEWEIRGISLSDRRLLSPCPPRLQLEEFFGTDIGSTIAFEIHDGFFYALSNQTSFDVEELDWTSFYHCVRFRLDRPVPQEMDINRQLYRRQHAEGPIHDSWTDLTLQVDESTNRLVIVESRREWQNGSSRQLRTFYVSGIKFPDKLDPNTSSIDTTSATGATNSPLLPIDDPFSRLVDSSNNPHWAPTQPRYAWNHHPEFPANSGTTRSFILARTKFRAYNYSCSSFVDMVEDEKCCNDAASGPCLRIRIGSRRLAPADWAPHDKITSPKDKSPSPPIDGDDVYRQSRVQMWPPPASKCPCSARLHQILNPQPPSASGFNNFITGVLDERTLVYMIRSSRSYGSADDNTLGTVVVIKFNSGPLPPSSSDAQPLGVHGEHMEDEFAPSHWHWTPGQSRACENGECR